MMIVSGQEVETCVVVGGGYTTFSGQAPLAADGSDAQGYILFSFDYETVEDGEQDLGAALGILDTLEINWQ